MRTLPVLIFMLAAASASYSEEPPSKKEIDSALQRGKSARSQKDALPGVLQKCAWIVKLNGVLCGQARIEIASADGESGAVYKMSEQYKVAQAGGDQAVVIEYRGQFLLGAGLGIVSAHLEQKTSTKNLKSDQVEERRIVTQVQVQDGMLISERREDENAARTQKVKLYKERPVPENALVALAAMLAKEGSNEPVCVPVLPASPDLEAGDIDPVWVSFDRPKASMYTRHLVGELAKKSMDVDVPSPQLWRNVQVSSLDAAGHLLLPPAPPGIAMEHVEGDSPELVAPFDLVKLAAAGAK